MYTCSFNVFHECDNVEMTRVAYVAGRAYYKNEFFFNSTYIEFFKRILVTCN